MVMDGRAEVSIMINPVPGHKPTREFHHVLEHLVGGALEHVMHCGNICGLIDIDVSQLCRP